MKQRQHKANNDRTPDIREGNSSPKPLARLRHSLRQIAFAARPPVEVVFRVRVPRTRTVKPVAVDPNGWSPEARAYYERRIKELGCV